MGEPLGATLSVPLLLRPTTLEDEWSAHTAEIHEQTLMAEGDKVNSWMMGANIEDSKPRVLIYFGGAGVYYDKLRESVDAGFPELEFENLDG